MPGRDARRRLSRHHQVEVDVGRQVEHLEDLVEAEAQGVPPALCFDFKADVTLTNQYWGTIGSKEKVYTGHDNGTITINIREADDVERERLRVELGEAQRTLLGHFRHEIGHYYWDVLVKQQREAAFIQVFGDPTNPAIKRR